MPKALACFFAVPQYTAGFILVQFSAWDFISVLPLRHLLWIHDSTSSRTSTNIQHIKNYGSDKSLPIPLEYSCRLAFAKAWERDRDMVISDPAQNKACWTSQKSPLLFICVWCGLFSRPLPRHSIIFVIAGDISLPDSGENSLPLPERVDFSCVPIGMSITIRPLPNK